MESQSSLQSRRTLCIELAIVVLLLVIAGVILTGCKSGESGSGAAEVVLPSPSAELVLPTVVPATAVPKPTAPPRVPVPGGSIDAPTGIAILPVVQLAGDRRYVLQVSSTGGAVDFSGSYSRASIDPKIAVDVIQEIKGRTPWEQEIQPPAPDSRTWTLGVTANSAQLGKDLRIAVVDVGPK
jgi:hypothetical protein